MATKTTGAKAPTAAETVSEGNWADDTWVNPGNIYGAGEASVTATTFDAGDQTYILKAYTFDFSAIPDTATIRGVTCVVNARYATALASIDCLQLLDTSRARTGTNLCATPQALTTTASNYTFGGGTNLWGCALTPAWVKDADFGVGIGCLAGGTGNNNVDVYIDSVTLNITYEHVATTSVTSFAVTGKDLTNMSLTRKLETSKASYAVTGQNANAIYGKKLITSVAAYSLSGQNLTSLKATRLLTSSVTSYSITGQNLTSLKASRLLTTSVGEVSITGQDLTSLKATRLLTTSVTDFLVTGQDLTNLIALRKLITEVTEFDITAFDAIFTKAGGVTNYEIIAEVANFLVTEKDLISLKATRKLTTETADLAIVGKDILLVYSGQEIAYIYRWTGTEWVAIDFPFAYTRWNGSDWV